MKKLISILISLFFAQTINAQTNSIEYLGQTPPGDVPVIFAPGIVSTSAREHNVPAVSPDGKEIYWAVDKSSQGLIYQQILLSIYEDQKWTDPGPISIPGGKYNDCQPSISPDGMSLYLMRSDSLSSGVESYNIICYSRQGNEWINPVIICSGVFPSVTKNGTIYYCGISDHRITGIFRLSKKNGLYSELEQLPGQINKSGTMNWTPYIAPDESYIIFSRLIPGGDFGDLMISFRKSSDETWTDPINLGRKINTSSQERQPRVSPDGKYLFFSRWISDNNEVIFWVSAKIIDSIKATLTNVKEEGVGKNKTFKLNQNYPNPFNPATTIRYSLNKASHVTLSVYNLLGQEIKILKNEFQNVGEYSIVWNANDEHGYPLTSGIYFYRIQTQNSIIGRKMVLVR